MTLYDKSLDVVIRNIDRLDEDGFMWLMSIIGSKDINEEIVIDIESEDGSIGKLHTNLFNLVCEKRYKRAIDYILGYDDVDMYHNTFIDYGESNIKYYDPILYRLCLENDVELVKCILTNKVDILNRSIRYSTVRNGYPFDTLFSFAVELSYEVGSKYDDMINMLLEYEDLDVDMCGDFLSAPVIIAFKRALSFQERASENNLQCFSEKGEDMFPFDCLFNTLYNRNDVSFDLRGVSAFLLALVHEHGDIEMYKKIVSNRGVNVNDNMNNFWEISYVCSEAKVEYLKILLERDDLDPNVPILCNMCQPKAKKSNQEKKQRPLLICLHNLYYADSKELFEREKYYEMAILLLEDERVIPHMIEMEYITQYGDKFLIYLSNKKDKVITTVLDIDEAKEEWYRELELKQSKVEKKENNGKVLGKRITYSRTITSYFTSVKRLKIN